MKPTRELLELAAKAAGLGEVWYLDGQDTPYVGPKYELGKEVQYRIFNPVTDDGDALRLAVKLNLGISIPVHRTIRADVVCFQDSSVSVREEGNDPYAATRRAIVRAAAEIGSNMK